MTSRLPEFPWDTLAPIADRAREHPDGVVDLSVGTPVDPTPDVVQRALCEALCVTGAVLLTHFSPLSIQRGVGVLCACAGIATLQALPCHVEGMEWAIQLLLIKYCVSHVPRHEPYT